LQAIREKKVEQNIPLFLKLIFKCGYIYKQCKAIQTYKLRVAKCKRREDLRMGFAMS
jgi:hypothetical protein